MAVLHHAFGNPDPIEAWAKAWGNKLSSAKLLGVALQKGFFPISETMSNQEYASLWDLLFDRHPKGAYYKGCFKTSGTMLPAKSLLQELTQGRLRLTPAYRVVGEHGPDHAKVFSAQVLVGDDVWGAGAGRSKQAAEQAAARNALQAFRTRTGSRQA